jgi:hypothetical protein
MKKIYLITSILALSFHVKAQNIPLPPERNKVSAEEVLNQRKHFAGSSARAQSFYMDHSTGNYDDGFYLWRMNSNYTSIDTSLNFIGLSLSKIFGFTNPSDPANSLCDSSTFGFSSSYPLNIGISIDTIFAQISHENNSGNYDKITMQIVQLTAQGAPAAASGLANVLWEQVDSSNISLSPGGNWLGTGATALLTYTPFSGFIGVGAGTKLGLIFKYQDPSKIDSLGMIAGYVKDPFDNTKALKSDIPTSYMRYPPNIANVTRNTNVGYGTPVGSGGWFFAQNWGMWAYVTVGTDVTGYGKNKAEGFRILESYPNPSNTFTKVRYEIGVTSDVILTVTDMNGKEVFFAKKLGQNAGEHTIDFSNVDLSNGIYNYTLTANHAAVSKRFVVQK